MRSNATTIEGPWVYRGVTVSCVAELDDELTNHFYGLYERAFAPLRTVAPARQVLTRQEFDDEMRDTRIWKYVAHDDDGRPIGLTTLTRDLSTVLWISPEYYAHRYPEQWARDAVFYLNFSVVVPDARHRSVLFAMLRAATHRVASRQGVCAYDVCGYNNTGLGHGPVQRMLYRFGHIDVDRLDTQTYYAARFTRRSAE